MISSPYALRCRVEASVTQIQEAVADYYGLTLGELLGSSRSRHLTVPRHVAMYLAREFMVALLPTLGEAFRRGHTTVLHACRLVRRDLARDPCAVTAVELLRQRLEAGHARGEALVRLPVACASRR